MKMLPAEELRALREEFPILQHTTYLNSCSCGALSRRVRQAMTEGFLASWEERGGQAWYGAGGWLDMMNQARAKFAKLIGASPEEIALAANVSSALGCLASALNYQYRNNIVATELDFPTVAYQWLARPEARLCLVESPDGLSVPLASIAQAIDQTTALVATSHVCYSSGCVQDLDALAEIAHRQGAYLLIDDYQGTGQVPINVRTTPIDFLVSGTLKWLLGGPGLAFLYVRKELLDELSPQLVGWFGHQHQLSFAPQAWVPRRDAARFELGTPSIGALYAANAALDLILTVGVERITQHNAFLVQDLVERARSANLNLDLPKESSAIVRIALTTNEQPAPLVSQLAERGIILDSRGAALRCSPHLYNNIEDNQHLVAALQEVRRV